MRSQARNVRAYEFAPDCVDRETETLLSCGPSFRPMSARGSGEGQSSSRGSGTEATVEFKLSDRLELPETPVCHLIPPPLLSDDGRSQSQPHGDAVFIGCERGALCIVQQSLQGKLQVRRKRNGGLVAGSSAPSNPPLPRSLRQVRSLYLNQDRRSTTLCLSYAPALVNGLLFTGGSDRAVRVLDPWVRSDSEVIVQTLVGHGASVTAIECDERGLISASNDGSVRVWTRARHRTLLKCVPLARLAEGWRARASSPRRPPPHFLPTPGLLTLLPP